MLGFGKNELKPLQSWINPKAQKGLASPINGKGLFAIAPVSKGEIIVVKAGRIIDKQTYNANKDIIKGAENQLTDDLYIAPLTKEEFEYSMAYCNHSCGPNAGFGGNILVVAMRDIAAGEEITIDYAMMIADPEFKMNCNCKFMSHRPVVTGNDWKDPGLRQRYAGYFSWYIQQKIDHP